MECTWPQHTDLQDLLFLLKYDPYQKSSTDNFPWNFILSLFNNEEMKKPSDFQDMLLSLDFDFLYDAKLEFHENLCRFKEFFQFISPISCSATEGDHRIELANRLLYGMELKQEVPFVKADEHFKNLPFNSTVFKPISTCVYLPHENSPLSHELMSHLQSLSRKTASQKELFIKDTWRSLYEAIISAIDNDDVFLELLYTTQKDLYEDTLKSRQEPDHKGRLIRIALGKLIAKVIFIENPTADLAKNCNGGLTLEKWLLEMDGHTWSSLDNNPFTNVSLQNLLIL